MDPVAAIGIYMREARFSLNEMEEQISKEIDPEYIAYLQGQIDEVTEALKAWDLVMEYFDRYEDMRYDIMDLREQLDEARYTTDDLEEI